MARTVLPTKQWRQLQKLLPSEKGHHGRPYTQSHRRTIEGILWIARTGAPWRDLPARFGPWNSVYRRFNRWTRQGVFQTVFNSMMKDLDMDVVMVDGTFIKVHPHGTGAPKEDARATRLSTRKPLGAVEAGSTPSS